MTQTPVRLAFFRRDLMAGGAERAIINLASYFSQMGLKVDLVLSIAEGPLLKLVPPEVEIIDLKSVQMDRGSGLKLPTSLTSVSSLPKLVNYLRQKQPKALISASHYSNEIAILAKKLARVSTRLLITEQSATSVEAKKVEKVSSRFAPLMTRLLYPFADEIVAISQGVAEDLAKISGIPLKRIKVIYNPVLIPGWQAKVQESISHSWFNSQEIPIILGVGRLVKQKDFTTLIKAFAKVRQTCPARLVILGGGREEKQLKQLIKELNLETDVEFLGYVNNPYAYMAKSQVFVLSSLWEGLPAVLIEALAAGTHVISTDCESGPREILDSGKYGELVPVADVEKMATAILNVFNGQGKKLDPTWLEQFTLDNIARQYARLLEIPLPQGEN